LSAVPALPPARAKKALQLFPGIGGPGAEKILMLCGANAAWRVTSRARRRYWRGRTCCCAGMDGNYAAARVRRAKSARLRMGARWPPAGTPGTSRAGEGGARVGNPASTPPRGRLAS